MMPYIYQDALCLPRITNLNELLECLNCNLHSTHWAIRHKTVVCVESTLWTKKPTYVDNLYIFLNSPILTSYFCQFRSDEIQDKHKINSRSNHLQMFFRVSAPKNFVTFTGKHLYWSLFLIKLQAWRAVFLWILRNI